MDKRSDWKTTSVATLDLSPRSRNLLQRLGVETVGQLPRQSAEEILSAQCFGETSLLELRSRLAERGLSLREEEISTDSEKAFQSKKAGTGPRG